MTKALLTEEQKQAILEAYRAGRAISDIAREFGCDQSYPGLLAKRRGVALRQSRAVRDRLSESARGRRGWP